MRLLRMKKIHEGTYLNNYELTYLNKGGREKVFELVSRSRLSCAEDIGRQINGVTIVAFQEDRLLLLKEFRMSINKSIYNLCAGMLQEGESVEDCAVGFPVSGYSAPFLFRGGVLRYQHPFGIRTDRGQLCGSYIR